MGHARNPIEPLSADQGQAFFHRAIAAGRLGADPIRGRLVQLACGHFSFTRARRKAACARCGEMIRSGYDYDAFRRLGAPDDFHWTDDPWRALHEERSE